MKSVSPVLGLVISSPKRTLIFNTKASSDDENGKDSNNDNEANGNQSGRTTPKATTPIGN